MTIELINSFRTFWAGTPEIHIRVRDFETRRQFPAGPDRYIHVMDRSASLAEKMGVFHEVGAKSSGSPIQIHLFDQAARNQSFQAIINGAQRDRGNMFLRSQEDFRGSRVVRLLHEHAQDLLALFREADTASRQSLKYLPRKLHLKDGLPHRERYQELFSISTVFPREIRIILRRDHVIFSK
jgi:hypothetical protein